MKLWLLVFLGLLGIVGNSQTKLTGTVKDSSGNPIVSATVTIKKATTQVILNYAVTDELGGFSIQMDTEEETLEIEVLSLGFKAWKKTLSGEELHLDIVLQESVEELKEVILKADPIRQKGDTIAYAVSAFKNQSDRTIADVIEKMPGLNILPSGQITYLGEPIEKYYIEGLDLMEGRYSMANESISADDVARVEILENHQPIRVLDSLVSSQRTSINIKLKNNVSLSGKAEIGSGFSPGLLKVGITPLLLSKKRQTFASYQYNNTGENLASNNRSFSSSQSQLPEFNDSKRELLEVQQLRKPPFLSERWLDNSDHYGTVNHLERLKKGLDLKINLSYLNATRQEMGSQRSTYLSALDTLNYFENIKNTYYLHAFNSKIVVEKNTNENYFRNAFSFQTYWDSSQGLINNNTTDISQQLSTPFWNLKNQFHILLPLGKQFVEFNSHIGHISTKQELVVTPGSFVEFFNNGEDYDHSHQQVDYQAFYADNTAGLTKKLGVFTLAPTLGFSFRNQHFESRIDVSSGNSPLDASNDYTLKNSTVFFSNKLEYKDKIWRISLQTPLFIRSFKLAEYNIRSTPLTFEPSLSVSKKLTPFWETRLSGQISNAFGEAENLYNGFILKNYMSLMRYDPILGRQTQYSTSAALLYRNALKALFGSLSASITKSKSNLIYDYQVSPEGGLTIMSEEQDNDQVQRNVSFNLSKYIDDWKTTISGSASYYITEQDQAVNSDFERYKTHGQQYGFKMDVDAKKWLSVKMKSMLSTSQLKSKSITFDRVKNWNNSLSTFFYFDKKQSLNSGVEHYYSNLQSNQNAVFLNLKYQYSLKKHPIDLSISWNNILNTKNYVNTQNSQYYSLQSLYVIRPSQILFSVLFTM